METTFELPPCAAIDRVEWTNEGNRVRIFYHIPEPPKPVGVIARPGDTIVLRKGCLNRDGAGRRFTVSTLAAFRRSFPSQAPQLPTPGHLYYSIPADSATYYAPLTDCETLAGEPIIGYEDD